MSVASGPEAQDALFEPDPSKTPSHGAKPEDVPSNLKRATLRLQFTPTYVIVGAYRLFNDETLYGPAWKKCKHGTVRGAVVGTVWVPYLVYMNVACGFLNFQCTGFLDVQAAKKIYQDVPRKVRMSFTSNLY